MFAGGSLRPDHSEEDRYLRVVDRLEFDAVGNDEQSSYLLLELRKCSVRDGDPLADARGLECFALE
jgi:hypothetical protein